MALSFVDFLLECCLSVGDRVSSARDEALDRILGRYKPSITNPEYVYSVVIDAKAQRTFNRLAIQPQESHQRSVPGDVKRLLGRLIRPGLELACALLGIQPVARRCKPECRPFEIRPILRTTGPLWIGAVSTMT